MAKTLHPTIAVFGSNGPTPTVTPDPEDGDTWGFKLVGVKADGSHTAAGSEGTTAVGPAVADEDNVIDIAWTDAANWVAAGVVEVQVWLTTAPGATVEGLVGTVAIGAQAFEYSGQVQTSVLANMPSTNTTGDGPAIDVLGLSDKYLQLTGSLTGTIQMQGTLDGVNWMSEGAAITAVSTAAVAVAPTHAAMRAKMTAYTSGTPAITISGHEKG